MLSVTMTTDFYLEPKKIKVHYSITNISQKKIYIFNSLWKYSKNGEIISDTNPVYISIHETGNIKLGKILHPSPKKKLVEVSIIPFVNCLESKAVWEESFDIPIPIQEYSPYYPILKNTQWQEIQATSVEFWLSWIEEKEDMKILPSNISKSLFLRHPQLISLLQTEKVQFQKLETTFSALRRLDLFERF